MTNEDTKLPTYNESMGARQGPPHQQYPPQQPPGPYQQTYNYYPPQQQYPGGQPQIIVQQPTPNVVVLGGGCPRCGVGVLTEEYGCCAILIAILFFPLGVLCCLAMRERVCTNCRARF